MDLIDLLSKVFWFVARPGNLVLVVLVLIAVVAWVRPRPAGRLSLTLLAAALVLVTVLPVHEWVARPLESRFSRPDRLPERIDGIIVLGGFLQAKTAGQWQALAVSDAAERIMVPAAIAVRHREARLVVTGRNEHHRTVIDWLVDMGLSRERIEFETAARNTFENALLTHRKIRPGARESWLLVTSAQHMPRAVGAFRKVGWPVIAYPVDYRTADAALLEGWPDTAASLVNLGDAVKEWIGLLAYNAMGRTDALFPAPADRANGPP